jgi:YbgC/YbaW family acyl-CoA thioester hydrolase
MTPFQTSVSVRFGDVDPAGIVYFPRIYEYLHEAFEDVWERHVGERYYRMILDERRGFPLVHSEVDFKHPLRFGDDVRVRITCTHLGRSSTGLRYRLFVGETLCVEAQQTTACVDLDAGKSIPMTDQHRARFEAILEDENAS